MSVAAFAVFFCFSNSGGFLGGGKAEDLLELDELLPRNNGLLGVAVVIDNGFVSEGHGVKIAHDDGFFESGFCR